jgi:hypothetical protein
VLIDNRSAHQNGSQDKLSTLSSRREGERERERRERPLKPKRDRKTSEAEERQKDL